MVGMGGSPGTGGGAERAGAAATPVRRLTTTQYWNSIADLVGTGAPRGELDPDLVESGFASVGASRVATSSVGTERYEASALRIAAWAFAEIPRKSRLT